MSPARALRAFTVLLFVGSPLVAAAKAPAVALLPLQDRAGDSAAALATKIALVAELARGHDVIEGAALRDELRRERLRDLDQASPQTIQMLGRKLGADELLVVTLHQAERRSTPRLTLSARSYAARTGEMIWCGFASASGLDRRTILGLRVVNDLKALAPLAVEELLSRFDPVDRTSSRIGPASSRLPAGTEPVALIPFEADTPRGGLNAAETASEALRAALFRQGVKLLSPNTVSNVLRHQRSLRWGGVTDQVRGELAAAGADAIVTGSVDAFEVGGGELEPEPHVAIYIRLLSAASGRILWLGGLDQKGWDRPGLFHLGRIYSRGTLTEKLAQRLTRRMETAGVEGEFFPAAKEH